MPGVFQEATAAELGEGEGSQTTQRRRGARAGRWVPTLSDCGAVSAWAPGPNVSRNILYTLCVFEHVSNFKKKSENKKLTLVAVFQRGLGVGRRYGAKWKQVCGHNPGDRG